MRFFLPLCFCALLPAQEAKPAGQAKPPEPAKPTEEAKPAAEQAPAESPAPSAESPLAGSLEVGYRFRSDVGGNANAYRSVVDVGEGVRVANLDFTWQPANRRLFDRADVRSLGWGGDPYSLAGVDARKAGIYDFRFDYRSIAYFNHLPSFGNPRVSQLGPNQGEILPGQGAGLPGTAFGVALPQRAFDLRRRIIHVELDLRPGKRVVPYLAYSRDSGLGQGITTYVVQNNEYPLPMRLYDKSDRFRGGVRLEFNRWHVTLEQGGLTFRDDQNVYSTEANPGNRTTPFLGERLVLNGLRQAYGVRGDGLFSRALVTANPFHWIDVHGQFLFSQPVTDVNYTELAQGRFVITSPLLFYNAREAGATAEAKLPHTSGSVGFELRPFARLRVIESLMTDRLHNAGGVVLAEQLLTGTPPNQALRSALADRLVWNYNQQQIEGLLDITSRLTVRGGHRFVWGDMQARSPRLAPTTGGLDDAELRRNVGLFGVSYRATQRVSVNADYEAARTDETFFRTSLRDYHRFRGRARVQALASLGFTANFTVLDNENPNPGVNWDFRSRDNSLSVFWNPGGGQRFTLLGDYSRSTLRSSLAYLVPTELAPEESRYREDAHNATALLEVALPAYGGGLRPRIGIGGSFYRSTGSRPTEYYQPIARVAVPLHKNVYWSSEWRWYGFTEAFYAYENFRAHLFLTGLRLTR